MKENNIRKQKPISLAINICDQIIRDEVTKKISLIGLFNTIRANVFPTRHQLLHVYVAITNGQGEYGGELCFINLSDRQLVAKAQGRITFGNPLEVCEFNFAFQNLTFYNAGKYAVEFLCDGELVGTREFIVVGPQIIGGK